MEIKTLKKRCLNFKKKVNKLIIYIILNTIRNTFGPLSVFYKYQPTNSYDRYSYTVFTKVLKPKLGIEMYSQFMEMINMLPEKLLDYSDELRLEHKKNAENKFL